MSSAWDDFEETSSKIMRPQLPKNDKKFEQIDGKEDDGAGCDWGFGQEAQVGDGNLETDSSKFIKIYESYLESKDSFKSRKPKNHSTYSSNPHKALREWFENEGHDFDVQTEQPREDEYICSLDLPVEEHDFTITSECNRKKQLAIDEICMVACIMLDECQLLYPWDAGATTTKEDPNRKRRSDEANKEDDIELDSTKSKRVCSSGSGSIKKVGNVTASKGVETHDSLMAKWSDLSRSILLAKAELAKLDLSVTKKASSTQEQDKSSKSDKSNSSGNSDEEDDDEVDPLDAYMSNLETKTKLSMDEKIEKSRLKNQITAHEREQAEVSRLIQLAKPTYDLAEACKSRPKSPVTRVKK